MMMMMMVFANRFARSAREEVVDRKYCKPFRALRARRGHESIGRSINRLINRGVPRCRVVSREIESEIDSETDSETDHVEGASPTSPDNITLAITIILFTGLRPADIVRTTITTVAHCWPPTTPQPPYHPQGGRIGSY